MFREVGKIKNRISEGEMKAVLHQAKRGVLAVNGDLGYPYALPVNFFYEEAENRLYFHGAKKGHKIDSIRRDDRVCFTAFLEEGIEEGGWAAVTLSAVVFGRAVLVEDRILTEEKTRSLALKYYPSANEAEEALQADIVHVQLIAVDIEHMTGKRVTEK